MTRYAFHLLRYVPNIVSAEFFNVGVFLYGEDGGIIDARFAPDFRRLRCNPLVELDYLAALRDEFEEQRLRGEAFSQYVDRLRQNLSNYLQISGEKPSGDGMPPPRSNAFAKPTSSRHPGKKFAENGTNLEQELAALFVGGWMKPSVITAWSETVAG